MEPPFNHLDSTSSESTFPHILSHNCHFSLFTGSQDNRTRGKVRRDHERAPLPNRTTPVTIAPLTPHLSLITPYKVISTLLRLLPFCFAPRAAGGTIPLASSEKYFLPFTHPCSSLHILSQTSDRPGNSTPFDSATFLIWKTSTMMGNRDVGDVS